MQDLPLLEKKGATQEAFRKLFTAKKLDEKLKRLQELHANRIRTGIETNMTEVPIWGAIDRALEAAQRNLQSIQARELGDEGQKAADIIKNLKAANLEYMVSTVVNAEGKPVANPANPQEPLLLFNKPIFDQVFVPWVFAYTELIIAKIFNDTNTYPYYPYAPVRMDEISRLKTQIVTNRVQRMNEDMGYISDEEQSIRHMVYYAQGFNFPKESYFREQYETTEKEKVVVKTQREGVRFAVPHPRRTFYDRTCPTSTFNSDTGTSYAGYWDIVKQSDVVGKAEYWNTDKLTLGGYDMFLDTQNGWRLWRQFYPCTIALPKRVSSLQSSGDYDRINRETDAWLLKDEKDASLTLAVIFHKLIPKEWGLFDYSHPVWMRFLYGNIDTCIHCEVIPYTPGCVYLDKYDANKTITSSTALQLIPFQQLVGNFLTQHFNSVRQNLVRIHLYNKDMGLPDIGQLIKKAGEELYTKPLLVPYSKSRDVPFGQNDKQDVLTRLELPLMPTNELRADIEMSMMVVERMLGFSPQMIGAPASHEQSAKEVSILNFNSSISIEKTKSGRDIAVAAKKRILYTGFYCYGDDEVIAELQGPLTADIRKAIKELDFSIMDGAKDNAMRYTVKGKKAALTLESFAATSREGLNRFDDSKLGITLLQFMGQVVGGPLAQLLGPERIERMLYYTVKILFPADFVENFEPGKMQGLDPQAQQQQLVELLAKAQEGIVQKSVLAVDQKLSQDFFPKLSELLAGMRQAIEGLAQSDAQQNQVLKEKIIPMVNVVEQELNQRMQEQQALKNAQQQLGAMPLQ